MNHFPATIPMPITKTPIKTTIEIPPYSMTSITATAIIVFFLQENVVSGISLTVILSAPTSATAILMPSGLISSRDMKSCCSAMTY